MSCMDAIRSKVCKLLHIDGAAFDDSKSIPHAKESSMMFICTYAHELLCVCSSYCAASTSISR